MRAKREEQKPEEMSEKKKVNAFMYKNWGRSYKIG